MTKKIIALMSAVLVLVFFGISCFADGSGVGNYDGLGDYRAFHQGYKLIQSNGSWTNIWSFDNTYTPYDGINSRYKITSTNYTLEGNAYLLDTYVYPPQYDITGQSLRQQHYLDMTMDLTIHFDAFVPYFVNLDAYNINAVGTFDCDVVLVYAYTDGINVASDTITISYEDVNSVNLLDGLGGDVLYIQSLDVTTYGGYMWDWLNIYCPIGVDSASSVDAIPYDLYTDYEVVEDRIALGGIFSWVDDFFETDIFGTFSLGDILGAVVAFLLVVWLLKVVAGG